jgi:hypothetical protein
MSMVINGIDNKVHSIQDTEDLNLKTITSLGYVGGSEQDGWDVFVKISDDSIANLSSQNFTLRTDTISYTGGNPALGIFTVVDIGVGNYLNSNTSSYRFSEKTYSDDRKWFIPASSIFAYVIKVDPEIDGNITTGTFLYFSIPRLYSEDAGSFGVMDVRNVRLKLSFGPSAKNVANILLNGTLTCDSSVTMGGDVSIGGSLTVPSNKGIKADKLTGSKIDIGTMTGGEINIGSAEGGTIVINHPVANRSTYTETYFDFDINSFSSNNLIPIASNPGKYADFNDSVVVNDSLLKNNSLYVVIATMKNGSKIGGLFYYDDALDWQAIGMPISMVLESIGDDYALHAQLENGIMYFRIFYNGNNVPLEGHITGSAIYRLPITVRISG